MSCVECVVLLRVVWDVCCYCEVCGVCEGLL